MIDEQKERWIYCGLHGWAPKFDIADCVLCREKALDELVAYDQELGLYERKEGETV